VSVHVNEGEMVSIMGPSGSAKARSWQFSAR
jgi:ABC-type lipoprotein export system ATPase subunit